MLDQPGRVRHAVQVIQDDSEVNVHYRPPCKIFPSRSLRRWERENCLVQAAACLRSALRHDPVEELQVLPAHIRPEHRLGVLVGARAAFRRWNAASLRNRSVASAMRVAVAERHEQAPPVGQDFFGVQVGRADHGPPGRQGIRQGAAGNLILSRIGSDVHVAALQVLQQFGKAEILVDETHMRADAQRLGHLDQALAIDLALLTLDLRVGGAHDQVHDVGTGGDDPGHGLDHVFQPLAAIDQSEGANAPAGPRAPAAPCACRRARRQPPALHAESPARADPTRRRPWSSSLAATLVMTTMPWLRAARLLDQAPRQRVRLGHQRVERGDDRLAAVAHEVQHAAAPLAGIEAELVLQAHHVARAVVGHFRGQAVGVRAAVVDDVDHARIVVRQSALVFWIAATDDTSSPAARSTASAESLVNVASPHSSGG